MYKYAIVPVYKLLHAGAAALRILELERDVVSDSVVWRSHAYNSGQLLNDAKIGYNKHMQAMIHTCLASFHIGVRRVRMRKQVQLQLMYCVLEAQLSDMN